MVNANYVKIGEEYYAPTHPKVKGVKDVFSTPIVEDIRPIHHPQLNETELRYLNILRQRFPHQPIMIQAITLRLAHNTKYTPDFAYTLPIGALVFIETKGAFVREDAAVKLKTAAAMFPQFTFIKAQYKNGKWKETVMPK